MRVLFAGSAAFAVPALAALLAQGHGVPSVLTRPDRAARRGMKISSTPVKEYAHQHGLRILEPACLSAPELQHEIAALAPDVMLVVAYGVLIPAT
ncbi:MAG: formyltransferase family protein, partial [Burkholderiales bacterium]